MTEYGVFGLGITIVCAVRRESFRSFGLKWEKLGVTVLLSALACAPAFVSMLFRNEVHSYLLFQTVNFTKQVLEAGFPVSLVGMVIIAVSWGFFEGFSYVVIAERVNRLFPVRRVWLDVYKRQVIGDATIAENRDNCSFIWENFYDSEDQINEYDLTVFVEEDQKEGLYRRFTETHYQRGYRLDQIRRLLEESGLVFVEALDADTMQEVTEKSERIFCIASEHGKCGTGEAK